MKRLLPKPRQKTKTKKNKKILDLLSNLVVLAGSQSVVHDISMPESQPINQQQLQEFYNRIAHIVESRSGTEPQILVKNWSPELFRDMRSATEVLMLMYGQSVSDRYLYGLCSAIAAMKEESGGSLPKLTNGQYELDKEVQDSHHAAQDSAAAAYFYRLEETFETKFPLSSTILQIMERDLRARLMVPTIDVEEGFIPGWYKAVKTVIPLFIEE